MRSKGQVILRRIIQGRNTQRRGEREREGKNKGGREKMHDYDDIGRKTDDRLDMYIRINKR